MASHQARARLGPAMHCFAMFLLLLLLVFHLLASTNGADCLDSQIRKPMRFGKRFFTEIMYRTSKANPCFSEQRRSDHTLNLAANNNPEHMAEDEPPRVLTLESARSEQSEQTAASADKLPIGLLLKVYSILRRSEQLD